MTTSVRRASIGLIVATVLTILAPAPTSAATINRQIPFSAHLLSSSGVAVSGNRSVTFRLYRESSGGTAIWTESYTGASALQLTSGRLSADLGSRTSLEGIDFNTDSLYLGVTVENDSEMSPRIHLGAAPYAVNADALDGRSDDAFVLLAGRDSGQTLFGSATSQGSLGLRSTSSSSKGKVYLGEYSALNEATTRFGVGTTDPQATLQATATSGDQLRLAVNDSSYLTVTVANGGGTTFNATGGSAALTLSDAVTVGGPATLSSTLDVAGAAGLDSTLTVTGAATFSSSLTAGSTTASSLAVTGSATVSGNLTVSGTLTAATQSFTNASVSGNLSVAGTTSLTGAVTTGAALTVGTDLTVTGNDLVFGNTETISNATDGTVAVTDGTNNLLTVVDAGTTGNVTATGTFTSTGVFTASSTTTFAGDITFSAATPAIAITNTETLTVTDGSNTLFTLADGGSTGNATITGSLTLSGDAAINGGDLTTTATTWNFDVGNTGAIFFRDGSNNLMTISDGGSSGNVTVTGTLGVAGLLTATSGVTTPSNLTTTGTGDLVSGDDLTVADDVTVSGQLNNVSIINPGSSGATLALADNSSFVTSGAFSITLIAPGTSTFTLPTVSGASLVGTSDTGTVTSTMILNGTILATDLSSSTGTGNTVVLSTGPTVESPAVNEFTTRRQNFSDAGTNDSTAEWTGENVVFLSRAGTQSFNLGAASSASGALVTIIVTDTSNNNRTVNETSAGGLLDLTQISGNLTLRNNQGGDTVSVTVYSDGTNWRILSRDTR